jgi:hypothetical protein
MRITLRSLTLAAAALLVPAATLTAFTLLESNQKVPVARGDTFSFEVTLPQAASADGTHTLSPNVLTRVDVVSMGDGSVRAKFFQGGVFKGETHGIIAILRKASAPAAAPPGQAPANSEKIQSSKAQKGAPTEQLSLNFSKIGFGAGSKASAVPQGQKTNVEVLSTDGGHEILIGLLVPAVQKVRGSPTKQ